MAGKEKTHHWPKKTTFWPWVDHLSNTRRKVWGHHRHLFGQDKYKS